MRLSLNGYELSEPKFTNGKPLYALHRLVSNPDKKIWVVEGEQKTDELNKLDLIATTSGGATSADATDWGPLRGRTVRIWPDNDDPGKSYAKEVTDKLMGMGCIVSCIDVGKLGLEPKEDCVDWLEAHPDATGADIEALPTLPPATEETTLVQQPEPLPSLPAVLPFDYDYLPAVLRSYVKDISERMQCPPDFAAVGVLVMIGAIIGRKVSIRPKQKDDWTVIPNLWGAVVGNSGVKKSPTLGAALLPMKKLEAAAFETYSAAKEGYGTQVESNKIREEVNKSEAKASLRKNKSADISEFLQPSKTDAEPILKRYKTNNASYEALGELLIENPNGLLVEADEIIGLLKQLDAGGQEVARSFYLTAADGDKSYTFDRIKRGKGLKIEALCLSIIGGIQPGVLAEYVRQATSGGAGADGLLQRFSLMVYPDISPECSYIDRDPDSPSRDALDNLVKKLDCLNDAVTGAESDKYNTVPFLRFDDKAQAVFAEWMVKLDTRLRSEEEHPAIISHLSKYRKLIPSLALINHLSEIGHGPVSESSLLRAIAFSEYLESHAQRIYSYATRPDIDAAKTLLKRLAAGKLNDKFTMRDIYQKGWTGLETALKAEAALDLLMDYRHLKSVEVNTGGRPTIYYKLVTVTA
jgi:putative DNA primase/helicase